MMIDWIDVWQRPRPADDGQTLPYEACSANEVLLLMLNICTSLNETGPP